ncbi:hypothetical protein ACEPPN_005452 [Leptodophora sp. 'Broadleaf-Isolate-01']
MALGPGARGNPGQGLADDMVAATLLDLGMVEGRVADECLLGDADDEVSDGTKRSAPLAPGIAQESKLRKLAHAA